MNKIRGRGKKRHPKLQELIDQYARDESINGPEAYKKYLKVTSDPSWKLGVLKRNSFLAGFYRAKRKEFGVLAWTESKPEVYQTKDYEYKIFGIPVFSKRVRCNV